MPDGGAIDQRTHRVLAGRSRVRVLEHLRSCATRRTAAEVAEHLGLHPNTVRLHLDQLADAGFVTCEPEARRGPGRPRLLFAAVLLQTPTVPAPPEPGDDGYRVLAGILAAELETASARPGGPPPTRGARGPARWRPDGAPAPPVTVAEATGRLITALDELGFAPVAPERPATRSNCTAARSPRWPPSTPRWCAASIWGSCRGSSMISPLRCTPRTWSRSSRPASAVPT